MGAEAVAVDMFASTVFSSVPPAEGEAVDNVDRCRIVPLLGFAELTHIGCRFFAVAGFQIALCHDVFLSLSESP
jgi:hypothetical protein